MIYPMLKELETGCYVEMELVVVNGSKRKNYSLSALDVKAYRASAQMWSNVLTQHETAVKQAGVETACCATTGIDSSIFGEQLDGN